MSTTMSSRDLVLDALRRIGRQVAEKLQEDAPGMVTSICLSSVQIFCGKI